MEWLFVHSKNGWRLKIDNIEQLTEYHKKLNGSQFSNAFDMYMKGGRPEEILEKLSIEERIEMICNPDFKKLQGAVYMAERNNATILDGFRMLNMEIGSGQLRALKENGSIFINPAGGFTYGIEYDQFCRRKEMIFPNFKKEEIRIKQFNGGTHYYAYIGDMQVRNGSELKWSTYDEAYQSALSIVIDTEQGEENVETK